MWSGWAALLVDVLGWRVVHTLHVAGSYRIGAAQVDCMSTGQLGKGLARVSLWMQLDMKPGRIRGSMV